MVIAMAMAMATRAGTRRCCVVTLLDYIAGPPSPIWAPHPLTLHVRSNIQLIVAVLSPIPVVLVAVIRGLSALGACR